MSLHDIPSSASGRAEVYAAVENLACELALLVLKLNCIVEANKRARKLPEACAGDCEVFPYEKETMNFALSADHINEINGSIAEEKPEEASATFTASLLEPSHISFREENAIAARVADLYERLGGFIKPSLSEPADDNT
jgi:hypothetical protein